VHCLWYPYTGWGLWSRTSLLCFSCSFYTPLRYTTYIHFMYSVCNKLFLPRRIKSASILKRSAVYGNNNFFFQRLVPTYNTYIYTSLVGMPESNAEAVVCTNILTSVHLKHSSLNGNKNARTCLVLLPRKPWLFIRIACSITNIST
jgi:hypothetical protein